MTIIFGSNNNACEITYDGYSITEFIFLLIFPFAKTLYFIYMNEICFFPVTLPLEKNGF